MPVPRGVELSLSKLPDALLPSTDASLFGPHAAELLRARPRAAFVLSLTRETKGSAGSFFSDAQAMVAQSVQGLTGWFLDVLRMFPLPLVQVVELPEDPFAEDLISVGFHEQGEHGYRAET